MNTICLFHNYNVHKKDTLHMQSAINSEKNVMVNNIFIIFFVLLFSTYLVYHCYYLFTTSFKVICLSTV
mgnify:CR=1 FL=1